MKTRWIEPEQLEKAQEHNEAFWEGRLDGPLMWVTGPEAHPGTSPPEPPTDEELWTAVDYSLYHLDGPDAIRHLPRVLEIESLDCVQWIHGAGQPSAGHWLDLLQAVQAAGKSVQVYYGPTHGEEADPGEELKTLCRELDPDRLFFWAAVDSTEEADRLVELGRQGRRR